MFVYMNKQKLEDNLKLLGLAEEEILLYTLLLEKGGKTVLEIARTTNINRSKIYRLIDDLKAKSLIESNNDSWGEIFSASIPESLALFLEKEEEELNKKKEVLNLTIEELKNLQAGESDSFKVRHYSGVEGLKQMLWNELASSELVAFGTGTLENFVPHKFAEKLREEHIIRKMKVYELLNKEQTSESDDYTEINDFEKKVLSYKYIDVKILSIRNHIEVYNNTIAFYNWDDNNLKGLEIESVAFSTMLRQIFWHYWEIA